MFASIEEKSLKIWLTAKQLPLLRHDHEACGKGGRSALELLLQEIVEIKRETEKDRHVFLLYNIHTLTNFYFIWRKMLQSIKPVTQHWLHLQQILTSTSAFHIFTSLRAYHTQPLWPNSPYFVSSRERPWRHSARHRINAEKRIICASIPGFLFERVRKHRSHARDNQRVILYHALTSRSFSGWDKV